MNPKNVESENCPAEVYRDRNCRRKVVTSDETGWMKWGDRVTIAIKQDGLWIPFELLHKVERLHFSATRTAA